MAESKKIQNIKQQLSTARDFAEPGTPTTTYTICANHRAGSNLLSEALYQTGLAGDPIEYFNIDFVRQYGIQYNLSSVNVGEMLQVMQQRRTSPNGVFGMNVKYDQLRAVLQNVDAGLRIVGRCHYFIFLYRKDKIRQAVSGYKGQVRRTFNVWRDDPKELDNDGQEIPFDPHRITNLLRTLVEIEQSWLAFFQQRQLSYYAVAYEDLVADYEGYITDILAHMGISYARENVPPVPTRKMRDARDEALVEQYLRYLDPDRGILSRLTGQ